MKFVLIFILFFLPSVIQSCILLLNGWVPVPVENRTDSADVVVSGYVKNTFKNKRTKAQTYKVEFRVNTILKGHTTLERIRSADNLYNISNFGDTKLCYADLDKGRSYILFLTTFKGRLSAKYDDIFGAASRYSKDKENRILASLGWLPWSDWSSCSRSCSSGIQTRVRTCNATCLLPEGTSRDKKCDDVCPGKTVERRNCNMFMCRDTINLLDLVPAWRLANGATHHTNGSLEMKPSARIHLRTSQLYQHYFPTRFSLILTIRPSSEVGGYILTLTDFDGKIKMALKNDESSMQFIYEEKSSELRTLRFDVTLVPNEWQRLAFSVDRDSITLYYDCLFDSIISIPGTLPAISVDSVTSLGVPFGKINDKLLSFKGTISELYISDDVSAARKQCADYAMSMNALGDSHHANTALLATSTPTRNHGEGNASPDDGRIHSNDKSDRRQVDDEHPSNAFHGNRGNDISGSLISYEPEWSPWTLCSKSCGGGAQTRTRQCPITRTSDLRDHVSRGKARCRLLVNAAHQETRYCQNEKCQAICTPPCLNGGRCVAMDTCQCVSGYGGYRCQTAVCNVDCANGGTCVAPNTCSCPPGYTGPTCNQAWCGRACEYGGVCQSDQRCSCRAGTHGHYCQYFHCDLPCQNGGRCVGPNACHCPFGTTGPQCQTTAKCRYCLNGGRCLHDNQCKCGHGYYGQWCERQCSYQPVRLSYIQGHRRLERYQVAVKCNSWSWRVCLEERLCRDRYQTN